MFRIPISERLGVRYNLTSDRFGKLSHRKINVLVDYVLHGDTELRYVQ